MSPSTSRPYTLRQRIRDHVAASPLLWRLYKRARLHLVGDGYVYAPVQEVLKAFAHECKDVRFVQVGSNDASSGDPIIDWVLIHGWRGLMVEPVPYVFERLRLRHGRNPRLSMECTAIGPHEGPLTFYCLDPEKRRESVFYDHMGSFSRELIVKHERFHPGLAEHIREIEVPCIPLAKLLKKRGIGQFEFLHIDAEGYDFEVLKTLDFDATLPGLLLFEYVHLSRPDREACMAFLEKKGYRLMYEGRDCMGLHASVRDKWPETAAMFDGHSSSF